MAETQTLAARPIWPASPDCYGCGGKGVGGFNGAGKRCSCTEHAPDCEPDGCAPGCAIRWDSDPDVDPFAGQSDYPATFCFRCGLVSADVKAADRHAIECDGPPSYRPVHCWSCATANWRRVTCRACGTPIR